MHVLTCCGQRVVQRVTFLEGHSGWLALQVAVASLSGDHAQAEHHLQVGALTSSI